MIQRILITILINLMPYCFTKFSFFRVLVYKSFNKHVPIKLNLLIEMVNNPNINIDI